MQQTGCVQCGLKLCGGPVVKRFHESPERRADRGHSFGALPSRPELRHPRAGIALVFDCGEIGLQALAPVDVRG